MLARHHRDTIATLSVWRPVIVGSTTRCATGPVLAVARAIEYGAQAIAAQCRRWGYPAGKGRQVVAAVHDIITTVSLHLDSIEGPLRIRADAILLHGNGRIYDVMVHDNGRTLLSGRLSVMIPTASAQTSPRRQLDGVE